MKNINTDSAFIVVVLLVAMTTITICAPAPPPSERSLPLPINREVKGLWGKNEWQLTLASNPGTDDAGCYNSCNGSLCYHGHWFWDPKKRVLAISERSREVGSQVWSDWNNWTVKLDRNLTGKSDDGVTVDLRDSRKRK